MLYSSFMIARLKGTVEEKSKELVVVDVQGVGYGLHVPETVLHRMPEAGGEVVLQVYTHVREDQLTLFGFLTPLERDIFLLLMTASGVGPKVALAILSHLDAIQILEGVVNGDKALFNGISGVGKKTVEKLFVEIREKAEKRLLQERGVDVKGSKGISKSSPIVGQSWLSDLEGALLGLGYREQDVKTVIRETATQADGFDAGLRFALQHLSGGKSKGLRGNA
jgi:Holliday junction DNA helicase RuvA